MAKKKPSAVEKRSKGPYMAIAAGVCFALALLSLFVLIAAGSLTALSGVEKVLRGRVLKLYEDDRDILEDALIEVRQAIEMANIYSNIMAGTMDAYASVVSNNLNIIMKVLTILTIIMTIPNIVFGFFGMNIGEGQIPGDWVWWMPLAITVVGCFFAWWMLKKKNLD